MPIKPLSSRRPSPIPPSSRPRVSSPRALATLSALLLLAPAALHLQCQTPQSGPSPASSASPLAPSAPTLQPFGNLAGADATNPLTQPTLSPGAVVLLELEARFARDVAAGGGKAFASWFADDAVTLNNGKPAILGRGNIALGAQWDPKSYQLSWIPTGAQMGPSNDMGFTWGRYEGRATDRNGQPILTSGRYMTVWKKSPDGTWKVALDASAAEPPDAGECCTLPKP